MYEFSTCTSPFRRISSRSFFADIAQLCVGSQVKPLGNLITTFFDHRFLRWASLVSRPSSRAPCQNHALNTDEDLVCTQCLLCNRQLVDDILCLRPSSVWPERGPPTPPARAAAKTRTSLTAQTSAAARAAFAAQAVATARAAAKVGPIGLSNLYSNGSLLMAWGWETANIGQSKLSWVLLSLGE